MFSLLCHDSIAVNSARLCLVFMSTEPPFSVLSPVSSFSSTPASPLYPASCWASPGWGSADGRAPLWGPWLWQLVKGPHGSARLSQQPLSDTQPSPSLQKLWCRQYAHAHTQIHAPTLMDSAYQVGSWEPPTIHSAKPQQLERLKPPHVSKRKSSRGMEEGIEGWEEKEGK